MTTGIEVASLFGVLELQDRASGVLRGFDTQMMSVEQRISRFGGQMQSVGAGMLALSAPIVGFVATGVKAAVQFESAFAGVRKTVNATEEEFAALEANITRMATSQDHHTSSLKGAELELTRIMELAGQLGVRGVDDLTNFTETVGMLGMTTNLSTEAAATELARFANVVGMPIADIGRLGSSVVALGNNFATTESEIVEMMQRIGGAGNVIGLSEHQISALAAALSSLGINPEAGGTAISRVMLDIFSAVGSGGDELEAFARIAGKSATEFAESFRTTPAAALNSFISGLRRLDGEGQNVAAVLESIGMGDIRVRDTMLRLATGTDVLTGALELSASAWEANTALIDEAGKRAATTESAMNRLDNNMTLLKRTVGEALAPALNSLIERLMPIVQGFAAWAEKNPRLVQGIVATAVAVAGLGTALVTLGTFIKLGVPAFTLLSKFASLGGVLKIVGVAIGALTSPIGLVIAGATLLATVLGVDVLGGLKAVGQQIELTIQSIGEIGLGGALKNLFTTFEDGSSRISSILEGFGMGREQAQQIADDINKVVQTVVNGVEAIGAAFAGDTAGMFENFKQMGLSEEDARRWGAILETVVDAVKRFVTDVQITFSLVPFYAEYYFNKVKSFIQTGIIDPLVGLWNFVEPFITPIVTWLDTTLRGAIERIELFINKKIINPLLDIYHQAQPYLVLLESAFNVVFANILSFIQPVLTEIDNFIGKIEDSWLLVQTIWSMLGRAGSGWTPEDSGGGKGTDYSPKPHTNPINWQTGLPFPTLTESYGMASLPNQPRAAGGPVLAGQSYLVGEQGVERFVPSSNGTIIPNHQLSGGGVRVEALTVNVYGGDPEQVKQAVYDALEELAQ